MLKDEIINRVICSMKMLNGEELTILRGVLLVALDARKNIENEYIFVAVDKTKGKHQRLKISGVEIAIRRLGRECGFENIHPHRFRRTAATTALRKGMPIEQVQLMLGHEQIDTTMINAKTDTKNVKYSHDKYM